MFRFPSFIHCNIHVHRGKYTKAMRRNTIREITEISEGVSTIKHRGVVREITEKGGTVWKLQRS